MEKYNMIYKSTCSDICSTIIEDLIIIKFYSIVPQFSNSLIISDFKITFFKFQLSCKFPLIMLLQRSHLIVGTNRTFPPSWGTDLLNIQIFSDASKYLL